MISLWRRGAHLSGFPTNGSSIDSMKGLMMESQKVRDMRRAYLEGACIHYIYFTFQLLSHSACHGPPYILQSGDKRVVSLIDCISTTINHQYIVKGVIGKRLLAAYRTFHQHTVHFIICKMTSFMYKHQKSYYAHVAESFYRKRNFLQI